MKKKFIVGTLLAASLLGCGTFTSCKDDSQDRFVEMTQQYTSLKATLEKLQDQLALLAGCPEKCDEKIEGLKRLIEEKNKELEALMNKSLADLKKDLEEQLGGKVDQNTFNEALQNLQKKHDDDIKAVRKEIDDLSKNIASLYLLKSTFEDFQKEVNGKFGDVDGKLGDILDRLTALEGKEGCTCPSVEELTEMFKEIFVLKSDIEGLFGDNGILADLQGQINAINDKLKTVPGFEDLNKIEEKLNALRTEFGSKFDGINETIGGINTTILSIQAEIADLGTIRQNIKDLQETVKKIATLESEITRLEGLINKNALDITTLNGKYDALDTKLQNEIAGVYAKIASEITGVETKLGVIDGRLTVIEGKLGQIDINKADIATLNGQVSALEGAVNGLEKWFEGIGITPAEFQKYVLEGKFVFDNHNALKSLVDLINDGTIKGEALEALNKVYKNLEDINKMYTSIFEGAQAPEEGWWKYDEVIKNIKANSAAIQQLQDDQAKLLKRLNDMVTSLVLQAANNPVFGAVNTPFGINSMVLMTQYGNLTTSLEQFPISGVGAECNGYDDIDWSVVTNPYKLQSTVIVDTDEKGDAKLGDFWFTVNPGTVNTLNMDGFALVNSIEETNGVKLSNITKDDETVLTFGVTSRAAGNGNGLYKANVTIDPMELYKIKVNIQDGLAQTLKNAVKNHTASDMAAMVRAVYQQLHNICQANALRYTYTLPDKDENGKWKDNGSEQKVYSNYGVAVTAYNPLSFATLKGTSIAHRVPTFSPIEISKDRVNLDLGNFKINSSNFNLNLKFGEPHFDELGHLTVTTHVTLKDQYGQDVTGDVTIDITDQAKDIQKNIEDAMHEWLNDGGTLDERIDKAVWQALFNGTTDANPKFPYDPSLPKGVIVDLKDQFEDMTGKIQDKLYSLVDEINKDYLGKVNSLINKYNDVAARINNFLADPNHYLQATMLYRKAGKFQLNGKHMPDVELPLGILSTNPKQPTQFRGDGEAIALWATTYNFEVLCPTFKKVVAVTKVTDSKGAERNDLKAAANKNLCQILPGNRTRVALDVAGAKNGVFTYEIAYQALDYSGFTSTVKCYLQVVR